MTKIRVGLEDGRSTTVEFDKPFDNINATDVMMMVGCSVVGWVEVKDD